MNYWLVKQEPSAYSYDNLEKEKKTIWDGVHNNLALKHIRTMKIGDKSLFYHTGEEKQVVGIIEITSDPYPNPKESDKRFVVVDVKPVTRLKRPVTLEEIKKDARFKDWELLKISRLSVMLVPKNLWDEIIKKSKS
ncbi:MAG: ubiquinol-cytochrome C reductase [Thaumarchaeota archaeon 13_1_20CM_2_39_20]|nr:MAG: ubiquinol-cytochrome C reductase [Thaumarchaeota archaeon 13_1_40CM_2_39_13_1]OLE40096.1 MAG: ubiquinol-cytochrome C reductase [Thaumarchaeota archaeon 13_1_20CM_2_39_20]